MPRKSNFLILPLDHPISLMVIWHPLVRGRVRRGPGTLWLEAGWPGRPGRIKQSSLNLAPWDHSRAALAGAISGTRMLSLSCTLFPGFPMMWWGPRGQGYELYPVSGSLPPLLSGRCPFPRKSVPGLPLVHLLGKGHQHCPADWASLRPTEARGSAGTRACPPSGQFALCPLTAHRAAC